LIGSGITFLGQADTSCSVETTSAPLSEAKKMRFERKANESVLL